MSPDGLFAVTADLGHRIQLVDLRAGRVIGPRIRIVHDSFGVFGRDGTTIYTSTPDGKATVWNLAPDHVRDEACALVGRNLTQEEWNLYLPGAGPRRKTCPQFPQG